MCNCFFESDYSTYGIKFVLVEIVLVEGGPPVLRLLAGEEQPTHLYGEI